MLKIAAIAPYEEFGKLIKKTFMECDEKVQEDNEYQSQYELEVIEEYEYAKIKKMKLNCNVVIARGFSAYLQRNIAGNVPVVQVPVTANEIIRCLRESKKRYGDKRIVVIGTKDLIYHLDDIREVIDFEIETILLPTHCDLAIEKEAGKVLQNFRNNEIVIVGGKQVCDYATSIGIDNVTLISGKSAISLAISEAKRVAHISRIEEEKAQRFKTILDYTFDGIISINKNDEITVINTTCEKILGIKTKDIIGKKIEEVLPKTKFSKLINSKDTCFEEVIKHNNLPLAVNKTSIIVKGERVGSVITFQYVSNIQEFEGRIRAKSSERGHIAKHEFEDILGKSCKIKDTIATAKRFSSVDSNVLITGKSGTGKELFAQSIHNFSKRKNEPFVAINCAAIAESLLESELFGYVEGAFTGARKGGKQGVFELAHRGTLFLDEISEMPLELQGRLLRVLQEKELMRLGHDKVIHVDVRIISATNKDLFELVKKGEFREDLYYRLDVLKLNLPSLDERKEDIPILVDKFIKEYEKKISDRDIYITDEAKKRLQKLNWCGNIRELRNACERLVVLSESHMIDYVDIEKILNYKIEKDRGEVLDDLTSKAIKGGEDQKQELNVLDKNMSKLSSKITMEDIGELLLKGYSKKKIAEELGIDRTTLWRRMKKNTSAR